MMKTSKYSCGEIACIIFGVILALFIMLIVAVAIFFAVAPGRIFVFPIEQEIRDPPIEESLLRRVYPPAWSLNGDTIIFNYGTVRNVLLDQSHLQLDPAPGMSPDISPEGTRVASVTSRYGEHTYEIITSDLDGENVKRVTDSKESSIWPKWSPDGSRIAFARGRDHQLGGNNRFHLYTMLKDGSDVQPVGHEAGAVSGPPVWSPDSRRLAFRNSGADALYVVNADGSGLRRIFEVAHPIKGNTVGIPTWSPDGSRIAFLSTDSSVLHVADSDGANLERIFEIPDDLKRLFFISSVSWSPDARQIAFAIGDAFLTRPDDPPDEITGIYIADPDGSSIHPIVEPQDKTPGSFWNFYSVSWSPDGSAILFLHDSWGLISNKKDGESLIFDVPEEFMSRHANPFSVAQDGSELKMFETIGNPALKTLSWSNDGSKIAVLSNPSYGRLYPEIMLQVAYSDGSEPVPLLFGQGENYNFELELAPEGWPPR